SQPAQPCRPGPPEREGGRSSRPARAHEVAPNQRPRAVCPGPAARRRLTPYPPGLKRPGRVDARAAASGEMAACSPTVLVEAGRRAFAKRREDARESQFETQVSGACMTWRAERVGQGDALSAVLAACALQRGLRRLNRMDW